MVRAQSKYGLMGSSAKTGKKNFRGSQEQFLDKTVIWDRTPPQLYIKYSVYVLGRAQGSQIFKRNSIISIHSKVMAFLVILLSPWSPRCPRHPHITPMLSPSSPHRPHSPQKVPMWSPWLWSPPWSPPHVVPIVPVVPTSSPSFPHHPCVIPIVPIAPRRSPCSPHDLWSPLSPWSPLHVVPMSSPSSPMLSPSSPCHPHVV